MIRRKTWLLQDLWQADFKPWYSAIHWVCWKNHRPSS